MEKKLAPKARSLLAVVAVAMLVPMAIAAYLGHWALFALSAAQVAVWGAIVAATKHSS